MHLSGLFIYPVKGLRGFAVNTASVDALGLVGDRRFLVVDETGKFLTQRTPRMAVVSTALDVLDALDATRLALTTVANSFPRVPRASHPARRHAFQT